MLPRAVYISRCYGILSFFSAAARHCYHSSEPYKVPTSIPRFKLHNPAFRDCVTAFLVLIPILVRLSTCLKAFPREAKRDSSQTTTPTSAKHHECSYGACPSPTEL